MMADRSHLAPASVTIARLVLPEAEAGSRHGLGDAIAAALARELGRPGPASAPPSPLAQAIAHGIASHPAFGIQRAGTNNGGR
jgi:hypothetical protein